MLIAYTDGVTEALSISDEEFGEERLQQTLCSVAHSSANDIREAVVERVKGWAAGAPQHDDLTLMVLKVK